MDASKGSVDTGSNSKKGMVGFLHKNELGIIFQNLFTKTETNEGTWRFVFDSNSQIRSVFRHGF